MKESSFIDTNIIKNVVLVEQVLQHYGLLDRFRKNGDSIIGPCPIHQGSNLTEFRVRISKNTWNCLGECKHGGEALDLIALLENISHKAAAMKAIEWFKISPDSMAPGGEAST